MWTARESDPLQQQRAPVDAAIEDPPSPRGSFETRSVDVDFKLSIQDLARSAGLSCMGDRVGTPGQFERMRSLWD